MKIARVFFVMVVGTLCAQSIAETVDCLPIHNLVFNPEGDLLRFFHRTLQVGPPDRRTEEEYAAEKNTDLAEVRKAFGATGKLRCGNRVGSAQVTVRNNVITTSAHQFMNPEKDEKGRPLPCTPPIDDPTSCYLELPGRDPVKVKRKIEMGFSCEGHRQVEDDWAVLELESSITDVNYYKLPSNRRIPVRKDEHIYKISGGDGDFWPRGIKLDKEGRWIHPKSISECTVMARELARNNTDVGRIATDCDAGGGGSGGSVLRASEKGGFELVGLMTSTTESNKEYDDAQVGRKAHSCGTFRVGTCETYATAVAGRLYDVLESLSR